MGGIFVLTWLSTRFLAKRLPGGGKHGQMQVIERLPLGRDRQIALLRVGNEHYLVGLAGQQISFSQPVRLEVQTEKASPTYSDIQEKVNDEYNSQQN